MTLDIHILLIPALLFLATVVFGFWVRARGRPYQALLFNIHKLIALAGVVLMVIRLIKLDPFSSLPALALILVGVAFVCALAMFVSGALLSIQEEISRPVLGIHQISAALILLTALASIYVLQGLS